MKKSRKKLCRARDTKTIQSASGVNIEARGYIYVCMRAHRKILLNGAGIYEGGVGEKN